MICITTAIHMTWSSVNRKPHDIFYITIIRITRSTISQRKQRQSEIYHIVLKHFQVFKIHRLTALTNNKSIHSHKELC